MGIGYALYMLPGFYLFMIDRYLRFLQSSQRVRLLSARSLACGALELNFAKSRSLCYNPTSIMFLNVPSVSKLQWHPFTISSSANLDQDKLSVVIKLEGTWTRKLYDLINSPSIDRLQVSVEGPYGPASSHFLRFVVRLSHLLSFVRWVDPNPPRLSAVLGMSTSTTRSSPCFVSTRSCY